MNELEATTKVTIEMTGRRPTIEDVRDALDILTAEGIPETFEVEITQSADREYVKDVEYADRPVKYLFRVEAERASKAGA